MSQADPHAHREAVSKAIGEIFGGRGAGADSMEQVGRRVQAAAMRLAAYSERFLQQVRGRKFRQPDTGNEVLFVSLPEQEQAKVYQQWSAHNAPAALRGKVDPDCPECGGTGWYTGLQDREPCKTCGERGKAEEKPQQVRGPGRGPPPDRARKKMWSGDRPSNDLIDWFESHEHAHPEDWKDDPEGAWDATYEQVLDDLIEDPDSQFNGASPEPDMDDDGEDGAAMLEEMFLDARGWAKEIADALHQRAKDRASDDDDKKASVTMKSISDWKTLGDLAKVATFPDEFMKLVEQRQFRQPSTGNQVEFVSLLPEEQQKIYARYQTNLAARAEKAKAEAQRKRQRPTFAKAKEQVFDHLDEAGWETRRGLKVPKAVKTIGDNQVILHFKPQAVWMEVRGRESVPARSLHDDLRDVDPAKWVESLGAEAESRMKSEEEQNAPYRRAAAGSFTMKDISDWKTIEEQVLLRTAGYSQEFLDWARDRKFRNDETGNRVRFDQLPPAGRDRVHDAWEGAREDRRGRRMWVDAGPSDELVKVFRVRFDEGDLNDDDRVYDGDGMFDEVLEELLYGEHSRFRGGSPDLDTEDDAEHDRARDLYEDARRWAHLIVDRLEDERKGLGPARVASLMTWRTVGEERISSDREDFERQVDEGGRTFPNPTTGNRVKFKSLPHEVQDRVYKQWQATRPQQGEQQKPKSPTEEAYERHLEDRGDESGMGHDDERQRYAEDGIEGWSFLPDSNEREAYMVPPTSMAMAPPLREPGVPQMKVMTMPVGLPRPRPGMGDEEEMEPLPPSEIRRQLADRMREMGRAMMISGMRAPRQQMMEIGKTLNGLIDQLDLLADQPGRQALKRRILLGLRQRVLSNK